MMNTSKARKKRTCNDCFALQADGIYCLLGYKQFIRIIGDKRERCPTTPCPKPRTRKEYDLVFETDPDVYDRIKGWKDD